jgi:hypothetical protein
MASQAPIMMAEAEWVIGMCPSLLFAEVTELAQAHAAASARRASNAADKMKLRDRVSRHLLT